MMPKQDFRAYNIHADGTIEDVTERVYTPVDRFMDKIASYNAAAKGLLVAGTLLATAAYTGAQFNKALIEDDYHFALKMSKIQKERCEQGDGDEWCSAWKKTLDTIASMESQFPELKKRK
ncbi:hypothetical protein D6774_04965 [Candidatus Woesearchaeota archaeon]|jgi:hypothetical protein|nr:MAG: hypothetical protein D6774_04965 [Candidatus Woesearchaeota archaeon]